MVAVVAVARDSAQVPSADLPLVIVMTPTGVTREGVPVYTRHPDGRAYDAVLRRGFSGRLLQLFRWEQQFLAKRDGTSIEPAYLLVSRNEGGFPRYGFWIDDEPKRGVGYVDLHERLDASGRFGAIDQIFPHELMHVIVHQLALPPPPGASGANQVHAIGVRTDRVTAFDEGFAEHAQVMAVDDPDAGPLTAALRTNTALQANATDRLRRYRRALEARWAPAPPARLSFPLWFSQAEQVLRYHTVKANGFAREASVRPRRFGGEDFYAAYLLENILPGPEDGPFKSPSRLLATEGVIASLFSRWVMDPAMQRPHRSAEMYARFGTSVEEVQQLGSIGHAYLKLFSVFADRQPHDTAAVVRGYIAAFPDEADAVATIMRRSGFAWPLPDVPEIWLANDQFMTGTTLFDQYRASPRVHTFDLNGASLVDLLTVDGVPHQLATGIQRGAPYESLVDLERVPGITPALAGRFRTMQRDMAAVREANAKEDIESLDLVRVFRPAIERALIWLGVCAIAGAWLYGRVRRLRVWRLAANGLSAAAFGLMPAWVLGVALQIGDRPVESTWFVLLPIVAFGVPAALWQLARRRGMKSAGQVLLAWTLACGPALLVTSPLL